MSYKEKRRTAEKGLCVCVDDLIFLVSLHLSKNEKGENGDVKTIEG